MPFSATGVYTPPTGAENATPGSVIKSATWNTIFTDISAALTEVFQVAFEAGATTITASTAFTVGASQNVLFFNRTATPANTTVTLPTAASRTGVPLVFKDIAGNAATYTISLVANSGENIEGAGTVIINSNYGGKRIIPITSGWVVAT